MLTVQTQFGRKFDVDGSNEIGSNTTFGICFF